MKYDYAHNKRKNKQNPHDYITLVLKNTLVKYAIWQTHWLFIGLSPTFHAECTISSILSNHNRKN